MNDWNEISLILSECVKDNISEKAFENNLTRVLNLLGWKQTSGNIEIKPSIRIGSVNKIEPDFVIKTDDGKKVFVIEIKQPNLPLKPNFQQQLFSYMRQLKLEFGILIGERIQIFYDGDVQDAENPILLENITYEKDNLKGLKFFDNFKKSDSIFDRLTEFRKESIENMNIETETKNLINHLISIDFKPKFIDILKQSLINEYNENAIDVAIESLDISILKKIDYKEITISKLKNHETKTNDLGVIASIKKIITKTPKTQDEILEELASLFPERDKNGMRKTIIAQLGGTSRPLRIEKERHFNLELSVDQNNVKRYYITKDLDYNKTLPIELIPENEHEFKQLLLKNKNAEIHIWYENGDKEIKRWKVNRFKDSSNIKGNLRSRSEFRNGAWQGYGITMLKVYVK
jgi:hypothetical protein